MKRHKVLVASLLFALIVQPVPAHACFAAKDAKPSSTTRIIALRTALDVPHFYFVARGVSVFVPTDFVAKHQHAFASSVMSVAPLKDHTDIHRGLIFGDQHPHDVLFIVADALEAGVALVYNMDRGRFASQISLVVRDDVCSGGRSFSLTDFDEDLIFHVTDWVS